jgi:hypothetical protein
MGIQCRAGGERHNHDTVAQVKLHFAQVEIGRVQTANTDELRWAQEISRRERAEDELVAAQKAARASDMRFEASQPSQAQSVVQNGTALRFPTANDWSEVRRLQRLLPELPHAYYAVELRGHLKFFRVDKPQEGRWAGRTFVKEQASDDLWPVRGIQHTEEVLRAIAVDYKAAMIAYGQKIGRCAHCHRTLTDDKVNGSDGLSSLERGIGPVCFSKMGW